MVQATLNANSRSGGIVTYNHLQGLQRTDWKKENKNWGAVLSSERKKTKQKSKQKHLKRDVSEVREEWPVDTEVAQTQISTFVQASVAPDPETPWTSKRWSTAARRKKEKINPGSLYLPASQPGTRNWSCTPLRRQKYLKRPRFFWWRSQNLVQTWKNPWCLWPTVPADGQLPPEMFYYRKIWVQMTDIVSATEAYRRSAICVCVKFCSIPVKHRAVYIQTQVVETFWVGKKRKKNFSFLPIFNLKFNLKFRVWSSVQQKKSQFKPYLFSCQPLEVIAEIRAALVWQFSVRGATKWDKMKVCIH